MTPRDRDKAVFEQLAIARLALEKCPARGGASPVITGETSAGTPVIDFTAEEYDAYIESQVRQLAGMAAADFVRAYLAGELDESDAAVSELVGLLRIRQGGHSVVA